MLRDFVDFQMVLAGPSFTTFPDARSGRDDRAAELAGQARLWQNPWAQVNATSTAKSELFVNKTFDAGPLPTPPCVNQPGCHNI